MAMCVFSALLWKVRILSADPLVSGCKRHPSLTPYLTSYFAGCVCLDCTSCSRGRRGRQKRKEIDGAWKQHVVISALLSWIQEVNTGANTVKLSLRFCQPATEFAIHTFTMDSRQNHSFEGWFFHPKIQRIHNFHCGYTFLLNLQALFME